MLADETEPGDPSPTLGTLQMPFIHEFYQMTDKTMVLKNPEAASEIVELMYKYNLIPELPETEAEEWQVYDMIPWKPAIILPIIL